MARARDNPVSAATAATGGEAPFRVVPEKTVVPDAPAVVLHRPQLVERFDPVLRRLTVLRSPGGFGKTTLLGEMCRRAQARGDRVVWLSIDERDDGPRVVAHLAYAADVPWDVHESLAGPARDAEVRCLDALCAAIRADGRRWVLAVDELDRIADGGAAIVDRLILRGPANLHLALACRQLPGAIDVATPIAEGRGAIAGTEELRFTVAELGSFLGPAVPPERVREFWTESAGWPIAARLRRNTPDARLGEVSDEASELSLNWVAARLMRGVGDEDRRFLLEAGCVDWADGRMFDEVLGPGSAERLRRMPVMRGLVQELDGGATFRLHPLVRRYAERELRLQDDGGADLRGRIARALAARGRIVEAMHQALEADDGELAAETLEQAGGVRLVLKAGVQGLLDAVAVLPEGLLHRSPRLALAQLAADSIHKGVPGLAVAAQLPLRDDEGDPDLQVDRLLVRVLSLIRGCVGVGSPEVRATREASFRALLEVGSDGLVLGGIAHGHAILDYAAGDLDQALTCVRRACAAPSALPSAKMLEGAILFARGDVEESEAALTSARRAAQRDFAGHEIPGLIGDAFTAELALETNRTAMAGRRAPALPRLASVAAWLDVYAAAVDVRAELALRRNAADRALRILEDAWTFAHGRRLASFVRWLVGARASMLVRVGAVDRADALWRREGSPTDTAALVDLDGQSWREMESFCGARIRLLAAAGECGAALELGRAFAARARDRGLARSESWATALAMHAAWLGGDAAAAREFLIENLRVFQRTGFSRALATHADAAGPLLRGLDAPDAGLGAAKDAVLAVLAVGDEHVQRKFTPRELEVLARLPHASDKEIARALGISGNGVRYHLKNIFGKLGVAGRRDAAKQARLLGLLPPPGAPGALGDSDAVVPDGSDSAFWR